ncbi:MAG: hypothetical protein LJE68_00055, partial [Rhodobacter sp.]|nr:hypothetical protein [Rhodobacter sp.]
IATRYRFAQGGNHAHDLVMQFNHRTYSLTADAKAQAPGVSGSDFAFTQAALAYVYQRRPEHGLGPYSLNVTAGQTWYGGDPYLKFLRIGGNQKVLLGKNAAVSFSASGERQIGDAAPDADILRADMRFSRRVGKIGTLGLSVGHSDSASVTDVSDYSEWRSGVDFNLAKPILGARVSFGLDWRQRDYPRSALDPSGRADREISASLDMVFTGIERFGFNPTLSINASRAESNVDRYDSEKLGVTFGIRSAF